MKSMNPNKLTYTDVWEMVFQDYKPKGSQIQRIFNQDSDYNQRLLKYCLLCDEFKPDFDKELEKLGFSEKETINYPDFFTPEYQEFYYNDKRDVISVSKAGIMVVTYKDQKECFESDIVGEREKQALEWLKGKIHV